MIRLVIIAGGVGLILLSVFAYQLGLDNDPGWGASRFQMFGAGLATTLFGALYWITPALARWFKRPAVTDAPSSAVQGKSISDFRFFGNIKHSIWFGWLSKNHVELWLILIFVAVVWCYVWIITIGRLDKWPPDRQYYWLLTQAFQNGQTSLLIEPNPELLQLENPYDLNQRRGLDYPWDITLYNGKYYLYWGPVPAVIGVLVNLITSRPITDAGLVLSFVIGTALFSILLLRKLYQDHWFPGWIFWGGVWASLINMPLVWLFTHPAYYEASIAGGQFFLMSGFYLLYLAFDSSSVHKGYLFLSALAFGLAGGTRISLLPSIIFLAAIILWRVAVTQRWNFRSSLPAFAAALFPLLVIAASLSWYNYARFGSIFEFGHRYQLTGLASTENYGDQISASYIVPSLYSYVFRLPSLRAEFPFVTVPAIKEKMWPFFINPPENYYYAEPVAGILLTVPLIGFAAVVLLRLLWLLANGDVSLKRIQTFEGNGQGWFGIAIAGYALFQLFLLLVFVSSSMRYLFDVSPALIVLSAMFTGTHIRSFEEKPHWVNTIAFLWILAAVATVISGFLIAFTGGQNNFVNKNPQVYYQFFDWFSR